MASIVPFGEVRDGRQVQYGDASVFALFNVVGAGYFSTLRLPVVAGREFTAIEEQDPRQSPSRLWISYWPGGCSQERTRLVSRSG